MCRCVRLCLIDVLFLFRLILLLSNPDATPAGVFLRQIIPSVQELLIEEGADGMK